jgi:uncharacterized protein YkwD
LRRRVGWSFISALALLVALVAAAVPAHAKLPATVAKGLPSALPVAGNDLPPSLARPVVTMGAGIDRARRQAGLRPVVVSGRLTRSSRTYARYMLAHDVWAHASHIKVRGFRRVGEILGMAPASVTIAQVVGAWLESPVHRSVMLDPRFRYFGIASATGRFQGEKATVWVVRFGA